MNYFIDSGNAIIELWEDAKAGSTDGRRERNLWGKQNPTRSYRMVFGGLLY